MYAANEWSHYLGMDVKQLGDVAVPLFGFVTKPLLIMKRRAILHGMMADRVADIIVIASSTSFERLEYPICLFFSLRILDVLRLACISFFDDTVLCSNRGLDSD